MQDPLILSPRKFYEDYPNPNNLSPEEIRLITDTFHYSLLKDIVDSGASYLLPFKLGLLGIFRVSVFGRGIFDYQLYKETGIKRYHKNNNTGQEVAVFRWIKTFPYFHSKLRYNVYTFKPSRFWKRYVATRMKSDQSILSYYYYDN